MSFALLSLLGFELDFGDENDGRAGGFFAIVVVIATAPISPITATPIFHTAIPHIVAVKANSPEGSTLLTGLSKQYANILLPSTPCPVDAYPLAFINLLNS